MIRRLFVYFTVALTLCFIISCKKDVPSNNDTSTRKENKKSLDADKEDDLVIRDDTIQKNDIVKEKGQITHSQDSVSNETSKDTDSELSVNSDNRIYDIAEKMPEFPGGINALNNYVSEKTNDVVKSADLKNSIRTMISFVVETDGTLSDIHVAKSSGQSLIDTEAASIVRNMPAWIPAQNNGINVRMKYVVPVVFKPVH